MTSRGNGEARPSRSRQVANSSRGRNRQAYVRDEGDESIEDESELPPDTPSPSNPRTFIQNSNRQTTIATPSSRFLQRNNQQHQSIQILKSNSNHNLNHELLGVSTSSTYSASSSRTANGLSTLQPFFNVSPSELHFFDTLISILPRGSSDFSVLKKTYEETLSSQLQEGAKVDKDRDAKLWDLLLSLLPIRGKTWSSKWDSVRMGIGMEPRSSDEEKEETSVSESGEEDQSSQEQHFQRQRTTTITPKSRESIHQTLKAGKEASDRTSRPSINDKIDALTAKAGSLALQAAHSSSKQNQEKTRSVFINNHQQQLLRGRGFIRESTSHSDPPTPPYHQVNTSTNDQTAAFTSQPRPRLPVKSTKTATEKRTSSKSEFLSQRSQGQQQRRKVRVLAPSSEAAYELEQLEKRAIPRSESQPNFPANKIESRTQRARSGRSSEPPVLQQEPSEQPEVRAISSEKKQKNSTPTQRRFDEVVKQARAERESLRLAEQNRLEAEEERLWSFASKKADSYYNENLCFKVLNWWSALHRKQAQRLDQVEMGRYRVLVGRSLEKWIDRKRSRDEMMERAGRVDEVRCLLGAYRIWIKRRSERNEKKKEERKMELKGAYSQVVKNGNQRLISNAWEHWYVLHLSRTADSMRRAHLQRGAFAIWQLMWSRSDSLKAREEQVIEIAQPRMLFSFFNLWKKKAELRAKEEEWRYSKDVELTKSTFAEWKKFGTLFALSSAFSRHRMQRIAFSSWMNARSTNLERRRAEALADRWSARRVKTRAVAIWKQAVTQVKVLEVQATSFMEQREKVLLSRSFNNWIVQERGILLSRVRGNQALGRSLSHWSQKYRSMKTSLDQRESTLISLISHSKLSLTFSIWSNLTQSRLADLDVAVQHDVGNLRRDAYDQWKQSLGRRRVEATRAVVVNQHVLERRYWGRWKEKMMDRKLEALIEKKERQSNVNVFQFWRTRSLEKSRDRLMVASFQSRINRRLQTSALSQWTSVVIERKNTELQVSEEYRNKLVSRALLKWMDNCARHADRLKLMQSFRDIKREELAKRTFVRWLSFSRAQRSRREATESYLEQRRLTILERAFDNWWDKYSEASMRQQEYEVLVLRQDTVLLSSIRKWKNKTKALPAIRFRNSHLKKKVLDHWRNEIPNARLEHESLRRYKSRVLGEALKKWISATKTKQTLRAAARFGTGASLARLRQRSGRGSISPFVHRTTTAPPTSSSRDPPSDNPSSLFTVSPPKPDFKRPRSTSVVPDLTSLTESTLKQTKSKSSRDFPTSNSIKLLTSNGVSISTSGSNPKIRRDLKSIPRPSPSIKSTPNFTISSTPQRKGKERERGNRIERRIKCS